MNYCKRCLYPTNHPLNLLLDSDGVCSGCRVHEEKDLIDWHGRFEELRNLTNEYRSRSGNNYDCIVPVTGGRDSWFVVHVVKNVLGLKPLLAYYNSHYNTDLGTRNLAYMRQVFDCDMMGLHVSAETLKVLNRASLQSLGSMYWHVLAGQTVWPVRLAIQYKTPLIIWGAHQGVEQTGMFSHMHKVEMTRKYRKDHDLMGYEIEDLLREHSSLNDINTNFFSYPHNSELAAVGIRGIYLSNYLRWDSKSQHELMIKTYNYETNIQSRTFDTYNDPDSFHYSGLHDLIKFRKWGYGKALDHACREIRLRRMSREQGQSYVAQFERMENCNDTSLFLDWMGMKAGELWELVDRFRDPRIWSNDVKGDWQITDSPVYHNIGNPDRLEPLEIWNEFKVTPSRRPEYKEGKYICIGKGYVDGVGPIYPVSSTELPPSSFGWHVPTLA